MALLKYKVLESDCKDGEVDLPEKATPIGLNVNLAGRPSVVFVMKYPDWVEEFPDDAKEEEAKKDEEKKKGAPSVE